MRRVIKAAAEKAAEKRNALRKLTRAVVSALREDTAHDAVDVLDVTQEDHHDKFYIDVTLAGRDMRIVLEDHHTG